MEEYFFGPIFFCFPKRNLLIVSYLVSVLFSKKYPPSLVSPPPKCLFHLHSFSISQKLIFPFENWEGVHTMVTHLSFQHFFLPYAWLLYQHICILVVHFFRMFFFSRKISSNRFVTFAQNLFRKHESIKISTIIYNS